MPAIKLKWILLVQVRFDAGLSLKIGSIKIAKCGKININILSKLL
jgi:hypothetical protein